MSLTIRVRPAGANDAAVMSGVLIASITELYSLDHENDPGIIAAWTANKTPPRVLAMVTAPGSTLYVAERSGDIVGVGAPSQPATIALNYVSPAARGTGVSTALLKAIEAALSALGHAEVHLEATATALAFYEKSGWRRAGPQPTARHVNGYPMTKILR